jgi:serine/threonine-protein kinase
MGDKSMLDMPALDTSRPIIPPGTQLNSIYEIDEPIATGGMGEVYRGHAIQTGDPVAIKLIRSDLGEAEAALALFRKEAAALHNLYHEAIVRYYVFTIDPTLGRPYLAMEFVDGQSLSAVLRAGPLSCSAVHGLMVRVASGLEAAHAQSIVHRDISPDNIIIPGGDMTRAKIIDFGIARSTRLDSLGTVIGSGFAGKYNYVSPEQLGLYGGDVTPRSDIYSLGLVLAEALRQKPLDMGGTHVEVIEKRRRVPDLGDLDMNLRPLIERMLQPDPANRPASMAEVAAWPAPTTSKAVAKPRRQTAGPAQRRGAENGQQGGRSKQIKKIKPEPVFRLNAATAGIAIALVIAAAFAGYAWLRPHSADSQDTTDGQTASKADGLTRYLAQYDGGPCFFVKPLQVTEHAALVEGYGVTRAPFARLDTAFRDKAGFEAEIGLHEVTAAQCPALALLGELQVGKAVPPRIRLAATALRLGQPLAGAIEGIGGRQVDLLLVADDGSIRRLAATPFPPTGEKIAFDAKLGADLANGKLQLLVAIASPQPAVLAGQDAAMTADQFFPRLLADAKRAGLMLAASVHSFKLDK